MIERLEFKPDDSLGNLDWGRGIWDYRSFWVWASASGFLPDGRTVGLNLGFGFGDTSKATENALILDGRVAQTRARSISSTVRRTSSSRGRCRRRMAASIWNSRPSSSAWRKTNLLLIASEVHQMFGRYRGTVIADDGEVIHLDGLIGWAEEHHARW